MKFRKKPVVIEAWQWKPSKEEWPKWMQNKGIKIAFKDKLVIPTLEGTKVATSGDWVIKGVKGELYACKPDIFEQTYEAVE